MTSIDSIAVKADNTGAPTLQESLYVDWITEKRWTISYSTSRCLLKMANNARLLSKS